MTCPASSLPANTGSQSRTAEDTVTVWQLAPCVHLQPCFNYWHLDSPTRLLMFLPVAGYGSRDTCIPALTPVAATSFHSHTKLSHQSLGLSPHVLIHREGSYSETSLREEWRLCSSGAKLRKLYWLLSAFPCFILPWIHSSCIFHSSTPRSPGFWFTVLSATNPGWSSSKWCLPWKPDWWGLFLFIVYMFVFWCLSLCIFWFWSPLFPLFPNWHVLRLYNLTGISLVLIVQAPIPLIQLIRFGSHHFLLYHSLSGLCPCMFLLVTSSFYFCPSFLWRKTLTKHP